MYVGGREMCLGGRENLAVPVESSRRRAVRLRLENLGAAKNKAKASEPQLLCLS